MPSASSNHWDRCGHFQHMFLMSVGWLYVVVIVNAVGGTSAESLNTIRMSMIASEIATLLQARRGDHRIR